ncbi:MAG: DUF2269 family protein [Gammaproteobacteria bacterium]|nr:DUF2269 family protein [Gammaproteobacteria bacterium]
MDAGFWLATLKVVHLSALVIWLGPSGGAWMVLALERRECGDPSVASHYLYCGFLRLLWLQHVGVLVLLGSGLLLLHLHGFAPLEYRWLQIKLLLVFLVILPIELADTWLGHARLPRVFAAREPGTPYTPEELRALRFYRRYFVPIGLALLLPTVVLIMWLAVAKPVWGTP